MQFQHNLNNNDFEQFLRFSPCFPYFFLMTKFGTFKRLIVSGIFNC